MKKKLIILITILLIISCILLEDIYWGIKVKYVLWKIEKNLPEEERNLIKFIRKNLIDNRGFIISEIRNGIPSNYSLLESFGEFLEYSVLIKNEKLFDALYRNVKKYFLSKDGYLYWRINRKTLKCDNATSLLDSIRILYSLVKAYHTFNNSTYLQEAKIISDGILKYNTYKEFFVDFYDGNNGKTSYDISLFYLDLEKIYYILNEFPEYKKYYETSKELIFKGLNLSYIFFPTKYSFLKDKFFIPERINMIEQSLIALYIKDKKLLKNFLNFLNMEVNKNNNISLQYSWFGERISIEESSGIYALIMRLYNGESYYERIRNYLKRFEGRNLGLGDHINYNFYAFDQMENLLTLAFMRCNL